MYFWKHEQQKLAHLSPYGYDLAKAAKRGLGDDLIVSNIILAAEFDAVELARQLGAGATKISAIAGALETSEQTFGVLLFRPLEVDLQNATEARSGLEVWEKRASAVLDLATQYRRKLLIVREDEALAFPQALKSLVQAWLSGQDDPQLESIEHNAGGVPSLSRLAAGALVALGPNTRRLWEELDAVIAPLVHRDNVEVASLYDAAVREFRDLERELARLREAESKAQTNSANALAKIELAEAKARDAESATSKAMSEVESAKAQSNTDRSEINKLTSVLELASANYFDALQDVEKERLARINAEEALSALKRSSAATQEALQAKVDEEASARSTQVDRLKRDIKLERARLEAAEAGLARLKLEYSSLAKATNMRIDGLQTALTATRGSTSWRLTAPIRALKSAISGTDTHKDADE